MIIHERYCTTAEVPAVHMSGLKRSLQRNKERMTAGGPSALQSKNFGNKLSYHAAFT